MPPRTYYNRRTGSYEEEKVNLKSASLEELKREMRRVEAKLKQVEKMEIWVAKRIEEQRIVEAENLRFTKKLEELRNEVSKKDDRWFISQVFGLGMSKEVAHLERMIEETYEEWSRRIEELGGNRNWSFEKHIIRNQESRNRLEAYAKKVEYYIRRRVDTEDAWIDLRNRAATNSVQIREVAGIVKERIGEQDYCPYCGGDLGESPHADHIYPVSKGGRSTVKNMVYVCASCNMAKLDMTLSTFIRAHNLNREEIEARLTRLGKEF